MIWLKIPGFVVTNTAWNFTPLNVSKVLTLMKYLGAIHMETLFCVNAHFASFRLIVHLDPVNALHVNALYWNLVSGWKKMQKRCPCVLMWIANPHTLHPTPRPLAFDLLTLWRLITTTTTTVADYVLEFVLQKILSLSGLLRQNIMLLCHYAEQ